MQFLYVILALNLTLVVCKRKYKDSSSEESIENVLYYQDCNHKRDQTPPSVQMRAQEPPKTTQKPQECKMCCSMCCGEECQNTCNQPKAQMRQPQMKPLKKIEPERPIRPMQNSNKFLARRDSGLTKENIKSLISQDSDIRKILKDLVRVTMQKVDLMQLLKGKRDKTLPTESEYGNDL